MAEGDGPSHRPGTKTARGRWTGKRRTKDQVVSEEEKGIEMQQFFVAVVRLDNSAGCTFNLDSAVERRELALMCWGLRGNLSEVPQLSSDNPQLCALFQTLMLNTYRPAVPGAYEEQRAMRIEKILSGLVRARSQKQMTLMPAKMSLAALRAQMSPPVWRMVSMLSPGLLASRDWALEFAEYATEFRPEPSSPALKFVGACMFDNYTRRTLYNSQKTSDTGGFLFHMTNSCTMHIPASLAPTNFSADRLYASPFGSRRLSMAAFVSKFLLTNPENVALKKERFTLFLKRTAAGTRFERPSVTPTWVAHLTHHPPMWYVLQSSYEDVEAELNVLRSRHLDKRFLFFGGDGLSIIRLNYLLRDYPELYQDSAPFIIPVQGESPHGVYHILHAGWRLYVRLIRICAEELKMSKAILDDPPVKAFNTSLYFIWRMTRAASEYLVHISQTPGGIDIDLPTELMDACKSNIDLNWIVNFLYHFAYLVLDFKQSVRAGASTSLDVLWREFFSLGRTSTANKTNYVPMAIMRIFWADAIHPQLAELYHNLRSIPMSTRAGAMVGWDCVIEWLNTAITEGVSHHVSEERIERFISIFPLLEANFRSLKEHVLKATDSQRVLMKDMDTDVARLKDLFMNRVGPTWATATRNNPTSNLGLTRGQVPWKEVEDVMLQTGPETATPAFVAKHIRNLTSSYYSFSS